MAMQRVVMITLSLLALTQAAEEMSSEARFRELMQAPVRKLKACADLYVEDSKFFVHDESCPCVMGCDGMPGPAGCNPKDDAEENIAKAIKGVNECDMMKCTVYCANVPGCAFATKDKCEKYKQEDASCDVNCSTAPPRAGFLGFTSVMGMLLAYFAR